MNKIIKKTLIAGLACIALCGTTYAAPQRGNRPPQKAPMQQKAPAHREGRAPARRAPEPRHAPTPRHHAPAPRRPAPPPPPAPHHEVHHHHDDGGAGWVTLGAALIGGIVGGIAAACN